ncbi:MAG: PP2C family protein-serine/threonine phosphatase [Anaerolineaceae bacterium]|nr:MAG: PP2C family protein-serine/threonine phosphatase [Anaerolineaceae bacterium]
MDHRQTLQSVTEELVTAQDQLLALYELSNVMRRQTSLGKALQQLVKLTCRTMLAEKCAVRLEVPGRERAVARFPDFAVSQGSFKKWFEKEPDYDRWSVMDSEEDGTSILLLPLKLEEKSAGLLICIRSNGKPFASPEGKLGQALANQALAFLENIILNEVRLENAALVAELRVASKVQIGLLPKTLPNVKHVDLWGSSQPAKHVGGDFYDAQYGPDGTLYFCVGDVSGKGMPAALLMAMLLMILRSEQRTRRGKGPAELLEYLNRAAYDELTESGMFATLFLGTFDPQTRLLKFANAGHSPVIFRPRDGSARLLEANNVPVGIFAELKAEEEELILNQGDLIVVGSDGLNEARDVDGNFFSIERLLREIDGRAEQSAADMGHAIVAAVSDFSVGRHQSDDQTCIIVKGNDQ